MCYVRTVRTAPAVYCLRHGRTGRTRRQSRLSLRSAVASISPSLEERGSSLWREILYWWRGRIRENTLLSLSLSRELERQRLENRSVGSIGGRTVDVLHTYYYNLGMFLFLFPCPQTSPAPAIEIHDVSK
jgi:hypothetical protein